MEELGEGPKEIGAASPHVLPESASAEMPAPETAGKPTPSPESPSSEPRVRECSRPLTLLLSPRALLAMPSCVFPRTTHF